MDDEITWATIDNRIAAAVALHAAATDVHGLPDLDARVVAVETDTTEMVATLDAHVADNDAHGLADVRTGQATLATDLDALSTSLTGHVADIEAHGLPAVRESITGLATDLAAHIADDEAHGLSEVRAAAAAAAEAIDDLAMAVAAHLADDDAHGLPEVREAISRAASLVDFHAVDLDPHGLVALRRQVAQQLAVGALPPLRTDEFSYADGPLTAWTRYIRQPSVLAGYLVTPSNNSLPYGITLPVTAPLQRIVAAVSFSAGGNVRFLLRDGGDDAAVISVESTGLVIHRRADLTEVTRLSLYELLPAMTAELLCDWSVLGTTVSLNVNGVPIYSFETSGMTGDAVSIALTNGGRLNRVAIYGATA